MSIGLSDHQRAALLALTIDDIVQFYGNDCVFVSQPTTIGSPRFPLQALRALVRRGHAACIVKNAIYRFTITQQGIDRAKESP